MTHEPDLSIAGAVRRLGLTAGRRALKTAARPALAAARASRVLGLARGTTYADEALAYHRPRGRVTGSLADLSEPARELKTLSVTDPVPATRPVTGALTLLDGEAGALVFCDNHVVDDRGLVVLERVVYEHGESIPLGHLRVGRTPLEKPRRVAGSVGYVSNTGVDNFGHWLAFTFPLVRYYREYLGRDPDFYYAGGPLYEWHYDSFAALGIERGRVLSEAVTGDRMLFACVDEHVPPPTPLLDFSTDTLRKQPDPSKGRRRLYISRGLRPMRRVLNEAACEEVLAQHGFESCRTEELTLAQETELFADAEAVVGLHGAGLTNILFCHPGCVIVELYPHDYKTPWFDTTWFVEMSAARDLVHATLFGLPTPATSKWGVHPRDYDMIVDLERLDAILHAVDEAVADNIAADVSSGAPRVA